MKNNINYLLPLVLLNIKLASADITNFAAIANDPKSKVGNYPNGFSPKTNSALCFTENKGQIHDQNYNPRPDVLFAGQNKGLAFHLRNTGVSYQLNRVDAYKEVTDEKTKNDALSTSKDGALSLPKGDKSTIYRIDINWLNCNTQASITKGKAFDGYNNYYLPSCPNGAFNVQSFETVSYNNIYKGINLKWYDNNGELEYDFIVAPGADYKQIQLQVRGAKSITLNKKGELVIQTPLGTIIEKAPLVKQGSKVLDAQWKINNKQITNENGNQITNSTVSFVVKNSNLKLPLIIDPAVRVWGTYYGGPNIDDELDCTTDAVGNLYLSGYTKSTTGIATSGSHQNVLSLLEDAFLVQFNSSGVRQWGTYYGGSGNDYGFDCATDAGGNVYLAGQTSSNNGINTLGAHQTSFGGGFSDAFLVQFNSNGVRQWGTYYGGADYDKGYSCTTDASGNVYLVGHTYSSNSITTSGAHQLALGGLDDAFLVKFNSNGVRQWGTYYGGSNDENIRESCATDASGNVYLAGGTKSSDGIASSGSHQTSYGSGFSDAFLVKFNSSGTRLWGTYYGGSLDDVGKSCATDVNGNVYLVGTTTSTLGIATPGAHQTSYGAGSSDAFLVQFNSNGTRQWGTYYGGPDYDEGFGCTTDVNGNVYFAGSTKSSSNIATPGSYQSQSASVNASDAFLVKFNSVGMRQWGTYYGGSGSDIGKSCATDVNGNVYLTGSTTSTAGIATPGSHQSSIALNLFDAFLVQFQENVTRLENVLSNYSNKIYPNPTNGLLTVEVQDMEDVTIQITSILGQIITTTLPEKNGKTTLNLQNLNSGVYFVNTLKNGKLIGSQKITKE